MIDSPVVGRPIWRDVDRYHDPNRNSTGKARGRHFRFALVAGLLDVLAIEWPSLCVSGFYTREYHPIFSDSRDHKLAIRTVVVDEVGYLPIDSREAYLFFQLVSHRYEHSSTIITSNKSFTDWQELFGDAVIATAILNRLLHHCKVVNIKGHSYRLWQHAFSTQNLESQRAKELINQTN
jgi:hypothetical protein